MLDIGNLELVGRRKTTGSGSVNTICSVGGYRKVMLDYAVVELCFRVSWDFETEVLRGSG